MKRSKFRFLRAYFATYRILAQYLFLFLIKKTISPDRAKGLIERTHQKTTQRIISNILILKGLYIKIGQTLSIMTNFLPAALTSGLEQLQDAVPPHPYTDVKSRFLKDFGKTPDQLFARFEEVPIASASLAQVHVAILHDGTKVAVKLQYPDIDDIVRSDLKVIRRIFGLLDFLFPIYGLRQVYHECARIILAELNFIEEGKNLERIAENFKGQPQYIFPKIYWNTTSKKILTAGFVDGVKVTGDLKKSGVNPHDVAVSLIHLYCKQIFIDGVYHADPHPGNIIVVPPSPLEGEGQNKEENFRIAMVDYGATASIPTQMREGLTLFVEGLIKRDIQVLATAMKQMGFIARKENEEAFDRIVEYFYGKIRGIRIQNFKEISIADFQHLGDILELKKMDISLRDLTTSFHVPKDWILLERALILMMGLVAHLDPHLNPMDVILPYVEEFVLGKDKKISDIILQASKEILLSYINLPSEIYKTLKKLQAGKISITDRARKEAAVQIYRGIHQLIYTLLIGICATMGYLFLKEDNTEAVMWMKYGTGFFVFMLIVSFLRGRRS